jgi:anti-sigma factor (TIGR02949 family)
MTELPNEIDCDDALDRLYEYLDGELTSERAADVRRHLERCRHCFEISHFETAYLRFLQARARARGAPEALKRRILERLLTEDDSPAAE